MPKVPTMESGTATAGMMVAANGAQEEEDHHDDETDGEQQLELDVLDGGADGVGAVGEDLEFDAGGKRLAQLGQQRLHAVDDADDVGAGLALNVDDDGRLDVGLRGGNVDSRAVVLLLRVRGLCGIAHPRGLVEIFGGVDDLGDVLEADGRVVAVGDDDVVVVIGGHQLVVVADGVRLTRAIERALGLVDVGGADGGADVLERETIAGQLRGVGLDAYGGLLTAGDGDQTDAGELRDLLREHGVGEVFNLLQRNGVRGEREREDRRVGRVDLGVDGRVGQVLRKEGVGGVDGGLHVLLGDVDGLLEAELERDDGAATGGDGGHLLKAGDLAELALERTGDRLRHHVGAGAGVVGLDLDDGVVDLRQRGDRQFQPRDKARKQNGHHQE